MDITAEEEMRQSGHICNSTKLCLLETPGYELNELPYSVCDVLAEIASGAGINIHNNSDPY